MMKRCAVALAVLAVCAAASAQPYGVVSVGASHLSVDCGGAASCDKSDIASKVIAGYKLAPNWAAEVGWFEYGKATASGSGVAGSIRNRALGVGGAYHQDLSTNWNAVARVGVSYMETRLSASAFETRSTTGTDSNAQPYIGASVGYRLSAVTTLELSWDFTRAKFDRFGTNESGNINVLSIGLSSGF